MKVTNGKTSCDECCPTIISYFNMLVLPFLTEKKAGAGGSGVEESGLQVGLDPDLTQHETENGKYETMVDAQTARAHAIGFASVPTYILDNKYAIVGAQPY